MAPSPATTRVRRTDLVARDRRRRAEQRPASERVDQAAAAAGALLAAYFDAVRPDVGLLRRARAALDSALELAG